MKKPHTRSRICGVSASVCYAILSWGYSRRRIIWSGTRNGTGCRWLERNSFPRLVSSVKIRLMVKIFSERHAHISRRNSAPQSHAEVVMFTCWRFYKIDRLQPQTTRFFLLKNRRPLLTWNSILLLSNGSLTIIKHSITTCPVLSCLTYLSENNIR
jgi:hypothetical protein